MAIRIKVFDECHERDLEEVVNRFLDGLEEDEVIDIKYQVACSVSEEDEQIYCFSACIIYKEAGTNKF
ncbi:sporulation protein Cse60 [Litchfieldia salsa]|uniref:Sporulation protein Cse60 n=1 Tax=Litchfieldia salsa TaxID=930152 RepID=A0A1H0P9L5_9BACI|nr:sporulation protein Cse60 [Litchfieldia salsa]SDP01797.1 Protein of unknown function [Litchfieldia salsa]